MAPEVGLEPTTPRLTAACSTIELLWNPKGAQSTDRLRRASIVFPSALVCRWALQFAPSLDGAGAPVQGDSCSVNHRRNSPGVETSSLLRRPLPGALAKPAGEILGHRLLLGQLAD